MTTILIVDDEDDIRRMIGGLLQDEGYKTVEAPDKLSALAYFEDGQTPPDIVLLDIWLEGGTREGLEILAHLKQEQQVATPIIMMSGHGTLETAVEAIKNGAYDFLEKPFKTDRLLIMLKRAMEQAQLRQRLSALESGKDNDPVIAHSKAMQDLLAEVEKVAPTKSRVMITGEAGSGKSVIARLLHEKSGRTGRCVTVHGAAWNMGTIADAEGGTLILEQPEDLPGTAQAELMRALQEAGDVRIITLTRADLPQRVNVGTFREDLYYRLNVVPLSMPPLAQRKADIPDLVAAMLPRLAHSLGVAVPQLAPSDTQWLQDQHWKGNVRELKNTLERFLILARPLSESHKEGEAGGGSGWSQLLTLPLKDARERFEADYLQAQLLRHDRNVTATAEFVGMDRAALSRKLKGLGISSDK